LNVYPDRVREDVRMLGSKSAVTLTLISVFATCSGITAQALTPGPAVPHLADQNPAAAARPAPTYANLDYAPAAPPNTNGHKLDLYIPRGNSRPLPVVIWTGGSAWMATNGKDMAWLLAEQLNPAGYAVAGVSIRSSSQVKFPGQLYDIKAAIRWLRANAPKYGLDPDHIAIMGDSSGGWTTAMAAVTGGLKNMEGNVGVTGVSSKVQAAVAFYPPTSFLTMDAWALRPCDPRSTNFVAFCHDGPMSPESRLVGCPIQTCPDKVKAANPMTYITDATPPIMILHGDSDQLVPHNQGEALYMALNKACRDAVFISLPKAPHGNWNGFLTNDSLREAATIRSTSSLGCTVTNPTPFTPTWKTVIEFLDKYMKGEGASESAH
jgi:acetyl esterase/lipase